MNNQKIDEILYSIQELILEAQNEKLDFVQTNEVIELNKINASKTDTPENNQDYTESYVNKLIKQKKSKQQNWKTIQPKTMIILTVVGKT